MSFNSLKDFHPADIIFSWSFWCKESLATFLDPNLQLQDLLTGVTFTSADCRYRIWSRNSSINSNNPHCKLSFLVRYSFAISFSSVPFLLHQSVLTVEDQLNMFKKYIKKLKAGVGEGEEKTAEILAKSMFIICLGSDDISVTHFLTPFRRQYDIDQYTSMLVNISSNLQQVFFQFHT